MEEVILVDENDCEVGKCEKIKAHRLALLHRAISIIVFNNKKEILIQKRAKEKYHCPGIWSNTCCTHPKPGENVLDAAKRRLVEEMGFSCEIEHAFNFVYKKEFNNGLTEYEYDHVFIGNYAGKININLNEVSDFKWISNNDLKKEIEKNPEKFSYWFRIIFDKLCD